MLYDSPDTVLGRSSIVVGGVGSGGIEPDVNEVPEKVLVLFR